MTSSSNEAKLIDRALASPYGVPYEESRAAREALHSIVGRLKAAREAFICLRETTAYDEYGYVKACVEHGMGNDEWWNNWDHTALAWRGVYPGMCTDPEICRGKSHCPRDYSCCE